jgi:hypothetical protein
MTWYTRERRWWSTSFSTCLVDRATNSPLQLCPALVVASPELLQAVRLLHNRPEARVGKEWKGGKEIRREGGSRASEDDRRERH